MGVLGYGRRCAGAMFWGVICTLDMGRRDGALCTNLEFRDSYSYELCASDRLLLRIWACPVTLPRAAPRPTRAPVPVRPRPGRPNFFFMSLTSAASHIRAERETPNGDMKMAVPSSGWIEVLCLPLMSASGDQ